MWSNTSAGSLLRMKRTPFMFAAASFAYSIKPVASGPILLRGMSQPTAWLAWGPMSDLKFRL